MNPKSRLIERQQVEVDIIRQDLNEKYLKVNGNRVKHGLKQFTGFHVRCWCLMEGRKKSKKSGYNRCFLRQE